MADTDQKQQAHQLVEQLDAGQLKAIVHLLRVMTDPVARAIANAPVDEEPLTPEAIQALDESRRWRQEHEGVPHEQVLAEFGFTKEEVDNQNKSQ
jgi:hypothetical protein